jgi:fluoroquinolone resistance protein
MDRYTEKLKGNKELSFKLESYSVYDDLLFSEVAISKKTKIVESEFAECVFKNCKFFEVHFFNCRFENCIFDNCDLASISMKHTSFSDVMCIDTKLTGIQWADASIPLDVTFRNCLLNYSSFIGVDLRKTDLLGCQLKEVDFTETNLSKANCQYSDFTGARFINTNLEYTDFTNATNYSIHPDGNKLRKTKFSLPDALSLLDVYDIVIK